MLDALVTEARLRFGLDPAAGLQVIASERLIATPLEPSRPALVVPVAMLLAAVSQVFEDFRYVHTYTEDDGKPTHPTDKHPCIHGVPSTPARSSGATPALHNLWSPDDFLCLGAALG